MKNYTSLVQQQLDAYNNKDVDGWLSTFAHDANQFLLHGKCIASGHDEMRKNIEERFKEPDLHARLLYRTVMNNIVVDHEVVTRNFSQGKGRLKCSAYMKFARALSKRFLFLLVNPQYLSEKIANK